MFWWILLALCIGGTFGLLGAGMAKAAHDADVWADGYWAGLKENNIVDFHIETADDIEPKVPDLRQ